MLSAISVAALALVLDRKLGARAEQTNYTIDDTNMTIIYSPSTWWFASNNASGCDYCLAPLDHNAASNGTWHHGLHVLPNTDGDDSAPSTSSAASAPTPGPSSPSRAPTTGNDSDDRNAGGDSDDSDDGDGDGDKDDVDRDADSDSDSSSSDSDDRKGDSDDDKDGDHDSGDKDDSKKGRNRRATRRSFVASTTGVAAAVETVSPFTAKKFDSDDPQFVDVPVFVQFNFSGSALYVNCLLPLSVPANVNMTPTFTNLTFTLDDQLAGNFLHDGTPQGQGFQPNATVFSQTDLSEGQHTFRMDLGPNSVFLLDSIVVTQNDASAAANSTSSDPAGASSSDKPSSPKSNLATFVGAIGGSVGTIAVIALCVAGNLIRRRRRAAKRDRRERERTYWNSDSASFHTFDDEASIGSGPSMRAVAPPLASGTFIPRYFPGIAPPPTYRLAPGVDTSYAEVLPDDEEDEDDGQALATVPEPVDDAEEIPPPFAVAIASPEPPLLATAMRRDHSPSMPNIEMSEAGLTLPLLLQTGVVMPRPPLSRPPSFHSTVSGSGVPSASTSATHASGPESGTDSTSMSSTGGEDSRSVRSVQSMREVSTESGVGSGEEVAEEGPTEGSGPSADAQGAEGRIREGEVVEDTIGATPAAEEGSPPVQEDSR
ncbi:hypothetical protein PENSPDRAFT_685413 [Peniophora sp. CONT]|nr:hypothetical protein PENSPDRAFT_685413 [Peniophora sp. CONT]